MVFVRLEAKRALTDLEVIEFFQMGGLLKSEQLCRFCDIEMELQVYTQNIDGYMWKCLFCTKRASLREGTCFKNSKYTLNEILCLIYEFSKEKLIKDVSSELEFDRNAIIRWYSIFRSAMELYLESSYQKLGGEGVIVQIDETVIAKRKYNRGRNVPQQWLYGAIDTITNHCILKCIDDRSKVTLKRVILETLTKGSIVHSDQWSSYISIFKDDNNFTHQTVNHSVNFVNPENGVHTNNIENLWMLLKQSLRRKYLRNRQNLELYLAEFCARHKFNNNPRIIFYLVCEALKLLNE